MARKYIVMMPNSWGVGDTIEEAEKRARKEGRHGRKKVPKLCWSYDPVKTPTAFIGEYGNLCWKGAMPEKVAL